MDATIGGGYPYVGGNNGAGKANQTGNMDAAKPSNTAKSQVKEEDGFRLGDLVSTLFGGFEHSSIVDNRSPREQAESVLTRALENTESVRELYRAVTSGDFSKVNFQGILETLGLDKNVSAMTTNLAQKGETGQAVATVMSAAADKTGNPSFAKMVEGMREGGRFGGERVRSALKEVVRSSSDATTQEKAGKMATELPPWRTDWGKNLQTGGDLLNKVPVPGVGIAGSILDTIGEIIEKPISVGSVLGEVAETILSPFVGGEGNASSIVDKVGDILSPIKDAVVHFFGGGDDEKTEGVAGEATETTTADKSPEAQQINDKMKDEQSVYDSVDEGFESSEYKTPTSYNPDDTAVGGKDYEEVPAKSQEAQQIDSKREDEQSVYDSADEGFESSEYKTPSVETGETAKTSGAIGGESTNDHSLFDDDSSDSDPSGGSSGGSDTTTATATSTRTETADSGSSNSCGESESSDGGSKSDSETA